MEGRQSGAVGSETVEAIPVTGTKDPLPAQFKQGTQDGFNSKFRRLNCLIISDNLGWKFTNITERERAPLI